jgi:hypothetical protein
MHLRIPHRSLRNHRPLDTNCKTRSTVFSTPKKRVRVTLHPWFCPLGVLPAEPQALPLLPPAPTSGPAGSLKLLHSPLHRPLRPRSLPQLRTSAFPSPFRLPRTLDSLCVSARLRAAPWVCLPYQSAPPSLDRVPLLPNPTSTCLARGGRGGGPHPCAHWSTTGEAARERAWGAARWRLRRRGRWRTRWRRPFASPDLPHRGAGSRPPPPPPARQVLPSTVFLAGLSSLRLQIDASYATSLMLLLPTGWRRGGTTAPSACAPPW